MPPSIVYDVETWKFELHYRNIAAAVIAEKLPGQRLLCATSKGGNFPVTGAVYHLYQKTSQTNLSVSDIHVSGLLRLPLINIFRK